MKITSSIINSFQTALMSVGGIACILYIMKSFGFTNPTIYENYPADFLGAFIGFLIVEYYRDKNDK